MGAQEKGSRGVGIPRSSPWGQLGTSGGRSRAGLPGVPSLAEPRISTTDRACAEGCAPRAPGATRPGRSGWRNTGAGVSAVPQGTIERGSGGTSDAG